MEASKCEPMYQTAANHQMCLFQDKDGLGTVVYLEICWLHIKYMDKPDQPFAAMFRHQDFQLWIRWTIHHAVVGSFSHARWLLGSLTAWIEDLLVC